MERRVERRIESLAARRATRTQARARAAEIPMVTAIPLLLIVAVGFLGLTLFFANGAAGP